MEMSAFGALCQTVTIFTSDVSSGEQDLHIIPPTK